MRPTTNAPVSVRINPAERALLEAAAADAHTNLSDFMRRKALEAAELQLLDRRLIAIPPEAWVQIEAWAQQPARPIAALQDLATSRPA
jgi:uncharacterized protein (DUF1778 family)